jgi:hypothetical protein
MFQEIRDRLATLECLIQELQAALADAAIEVQDEASLLTDLLTALNFVGDGVTATATEGVVTVSIPGGFGGANLSTTQVGETVTINSDSGSNAVIAAATNLIAGVLTAADKIKLDAIEAGATADQTGQEIADLLDALFGNQNWQMGGQAGITNLSVTKTSLTNIIESSTGDNATLTAATEALAGLMTASDKANLTANTASRHNEATSNSDAISIDEDQVFNLEVSADADNAVEVRPDGIYVDGATLSGAQTNLSNTRDPIQVDLASSTGDDTVLEAATQLLAGVMTAADKLKLDTIEDGAEVNPTQGELETIIQNYLDANPPGEIGYVKVDLSGILVEAHYTGVVPVISGGGSAFLVTIPSGSMLQSITFDMDSTTTFQVDFVNNNEDGSNDTVFKDRFNVHILNKQTNIVSHSPEQDFGIVHTRTVNAANSVRDNLAGLNVFNLGYEITFSK